MLRLNVCFQLPFRKHLSSCSNGLSFLWVCGLALLLVLFCSHFLPFQEEHAEWASYLLLGTAFPLAVLSVFLIERRLPDIHPLVNPIKSGLGLSFLAVSIYYLFHFNDITVPILIVSFISWVVMLCIVTATNRSTHNFDAGIALIAIPIVLISWAVSIKLICPQPFIPWLIASRFTTLIFIPSFLLVSTNLLLWPALPTRRIPRLLTIENFIAICLFGLASIRIDVIPEGAFLHWSAFIGPAELIRQGGWLLWNVPSQYGFLNTVLLSILPTNSVWQALYIIDSLLCWVVATIVFLLLRFPRGGMTNYVFAFLITLASVFTLSAHHSLPSTGAWRFVWCYVLLLILLLNVNTHHRTATFLWFGTIAWLIGTLWSAESAIYCAAIWLPAYVCLILQRALSPEARLDRRGGVMAIISSRIAIGRYRRDHGVLSFAARSVA